MRQTLFRQSGVLAQRYSAVLLGDPLRILLFLCQAPLAVGILLLIQQESSLPSETLALWLPLAAFWGGGFTACQELVRERAIFQREQVLGITIPAYVLSKFRLLSVIAFLQAALLLLLFSAAFSLSENLFFWWVFVYLCALVGISFGLFMSAIAPNRLAALSIVVIFALVHLALFYDAIALGNPLSVLEYTPARMGITMARALVTSDPDMFALLTGVGILGLWGGICGVLTILLLRRVNR